MKKIFAVLLFFVVSTLVLACAGGPGAGDATVHLTDQNFAQSSVTIGKGHTIKLINDVATAHSIENGQWVDGNAQQAQENGAPTINDEFIGNDTQTIGPFNTTGVFHIFCSIHQGMNLTITVQ